VGDIAATRVFGGGLDGSVDVAMIVLRVGSRDDEGDLTTINA
jgi:hypothetical protein